MDLNSSTGKPEVLIDREKLAPLIKTAALNRTATIAPAI